MKIKKEVPQFYISRLTSSFTCVSPASSSHGSRYIVVLAGGNTWTNNDVIIGFLPPICHSYIYIYIEREKEIERERERKRERESRKNCTWLNKTTIYKLINFYFFKLSENLLKNRISKIFPCKLSQSVNNSK